MKKLIVYFSATGNTYEWVTALAEALRADVFNIESSRNFPEDFELLGIAYPVFAWAAPVIVKKFIQNRLPSGRGRKAFIFQTFGGIPGNAAWKVAKELKNRGYQVVGAWGARCEDSHPSLRRKWTMPFIKVGSPTEQEISKGVEKIAKSIENAVKQPVKIKYKFYWFLLDLFEKFFIYIMKHRWITSACINCSLCYRLCPVRALFYNGEKIVHNFEKCIACYRCVNVCPVNAMRGLGTAGGIKYFRKNYLAFLVGNVYNLSMEINDKREVNL